MTNKQIVLAELIRAWQMAMIVRDWKEARKLLAQIREVRAGT